MVSRKGAKFAKRGKKRKFLAELAKRGKKREFLAENAEEGQTFKSCELRVVS